MSAGDVGERYFEKVYGRDGVTKRRADEEIHYSNVKSVAFAFPNRALRERGEKEWKK